MSYFSSLLLFHPATPPELTLGEFKEFASTLRNSIGISPGSHTGVQLKWGQRPDQDYQDMEEILWDDSEVIGTVSEKEWDHDESGDNFEALWPDEDSQRTLYRGFINLGSLTKETSVSLTAFEEGSSHAFIIPDSASVKIGPIIPGTMEDEEDVCTGLVAVSFAGNGYFSWGRSFDDYATQYREAPAIKVSKEICRRSFPVERGERFDRIAKHLGKLFLNRDDYQDGDWILSISE